MKLFKSNLMILASMLIFVGTAFAVENSRSEAIDNKLNAAKSKIQVQYKAKTILVKQSEPLSIGDPVDVDGDITRECEFDWSEYGAANCDVAWTDFGISCADLEANYGWDSFKSGQRTVIEATLNGQDVLKLHQINWNHIEYLFIYMNYHQIFIHIGI